MRTDSLMPASAADRTLILAALEEMVASGPFRSSRRYPAMPRYIVEKTLANEHGELKERLIGVEVFGRDPGYDTNADPVVRFSAGEVRKRIAQFYRESKNAGPIEVELPLGSYVPRFYRRDASSVESESILPVEVDAEAVPSQLPGDIDAVAIEVRDARRMGWPYYLVALLGIGLIVGVWMHKSTRSVDPLMEVWSPLLDHSNPILISAGRPHAPEDEVPKQSNLTIQDHILGPEFRVTIPTLSAIVNVVTFLQSEQEPFRIHEAYSNTLADLHHRPVVLVTGNDNKWTKILLQPLRFHFVQEGDFSYIADHENPGFRAWNVDFTKLFSQQTADYAIVARFRSETTGAPVMVIAGISSNGTEAAGEFVVSPQELSKLEKMGNDLAKNFEVVLKVEVVDGNTGSSTVIARQFW